MIYDNSAVRRQDRLLDELSATELLVSGEYGVLSMATAEGGAYGIPVNYVWDGAGNIYIHCAPEGRKLRCIGPGARVSFCVVGVTRVIPSQFTTEYESIIMECIASKGLPEKEKRTALEMLAGKYSPEEKELAPVYIEKSFARTEVIKLNIVSWSGKRKSVRK